GLAFSGQLEPGAGVDSGRLLHGEDALVLHLAGTFADLELVGDQLARAGAVAARPRDRREALRQAPLAVTLGGVAVLRRSTGPARRLVAEAIVEGALVRVGEHLVGLGELLELLLGLLVPRVLVRMVLDGELAERALQLLRGAAPLDSEHFVVVTFVGVHRGGPRGWTTVRPPGRQTDVLNLRQGKSLSTPD